MSNVSAAATQWNVPNYVGELYLIGANQTPFLNMIGGLQGGAVAVVQAFDFPVAQPYSLESAAQPAITETASLTASSFLVSYVRGQDINTVQIFEKTISASYAKQSITGAIYVSGAGNVMLGTQPVGNEMDFQAAATLKQVAIDVEYTFLQGSYQQATDAGTAAKTRGMNAACSTTKINASSGALTKTLMDQMLRTMAAAGAPFTNVVVFVNAFQKQKLSNIYGYAPEDRNIGGVNVKQIETDFGMLGVVWAPFQSTSVLLAAELSVCRPVFCPVPGKGVLFRDVLAKTGAGDTEMIYGQIGLDHGPEEYHGEIYGLATS
jgi:hypothetical protein